MELFDGQVDATVEAHSLPNGVMQGIRKVTQERGLASREEAEFLFTMDRVGFVSGADWLPLAVKSMVAFIVWDKRPTGHVTEADVDWLVGLVGDQPTAFGRAVVFAVVREAEDVPARLSELAMRAAVGRCLLI